MAPQTDDDKFRENRRVNLEHQFHHDMIGVADFSNANGFGQVFSRMLGEYGGVETAKRLLATSEVQSGFTELCLLNAVHRSMEAFVIKPQYQSLFTEAEVAEAHRRLEEVGYFNK